MRTVRPNQPHPCKFSFPSDQGLSTKSYASWGSALKEIKDSGGGNEQQQKKHICLMMCVIFVRFRVQEPEALGFKNECDCSVVVSEPLPVHHDCEHILKISSLHLSQRKQHSERLSQILRLHQKKVKRLTTYKTSVAFETQEIFFLHTRNVSCFATRFTTRVTRSFVLS